MNEKSPEVRVKGFLSRELQLYELFVWQVYMNGVSLQLSTAFDLNCSGTQKINNRWAFVGRNRNIMKLHTQSNYLCIVYVTWYWKKEEKYFDKIERANSISSVVEHKFTNDNVVDSYRGPQEERQPESNL